MKNENLPDTFKRLDDANKGKDVPNCGYVQAAANMTSRGRAIIQEAEEARKGLDSFPPARLLHKHKP